MKVFQSILAIIFCFVGVAQELPPVIKYSPYDYGGENQNWMLSQDAKGFMYVANSKGLLQFNGEDWNLYASPNNTILRSVKVINDKVYTGCYEELGYWNTDDFGQLKYVSLMPKLNSFKFEEDQIWNILDYDEWVLFQSSYTLFFYNKVSQDFKTISSENNIYKVFNINDQIYFHVANEGIYAIEEGMPKLINSDPVILRDRVINIFERNNVLTLLTRNSGFYQLAEGRLQSLEFPVNEKLKQLNIFASIQLQDNSTVIGTISNGVLKIDEKGFEDYGINQKSGLANNTVLALFEDADKNVWAALDNGISCVNDNSPIKNFIDYEGVLGTIYTTLIHDDFFYVGTNQGLFYKSLKTATETFKFVKGTAGQVWTLYSTGDKLFCGHHLGTFQIDGENSRRVSDILGAWSFRNIPNQPNLLLQGNYDGLYVLEQNLGEWQFRNKIEGFKNSARQFEFSKSNEVLVNHEYKGVYRLEFDADFLSVTNESVQQELKLGKNSSLVSYKDKILYAYENDIFQFDPKKNLFIRDSVLNDLFTSSTNEIDKILADDNGKLWYFSENNIGYVINDNLTNKPEIVNIAFPSNLRKGVKGFENLQHIENNQYVLGTSNGYLMLNIPEMIESQTYTIYLDAAKHIDPRGEETNLDANDPQKLKHKSSTLSFSFAVPEYGKYTDVKYQYKLDGFQNYWSAWGDNSSVKFENLPFGDYAFKARAKVGNKLTQNTLNYNFKVDRPWYISNLAFLIYLIFLVCIGFFIHKAYKFYYERILKHEQIKNERAIIQVKNEKLNHDIESKNRELAISTMSIIKKNEVLNKIKKELKNSNNKSATGAIDLIDNNLNNSKDWKFFKKAFNNADKDFFDKIKSTHPELTANDLKFCAYLRLNLSSKEIAPLLNISTKSVETKRYRLRKRLKLDHNKGLVDYILKF